MITIKTWYKDGEKILSSSPTLIPIHTNLFVKFAEEKQTRNVGSTDGESVALILIPTALLGRTITKQRGSYKYVIHPPTLAM